jgi:hypothetical protein
MKNPTVNRDICGTPAGYRAHTKRVEERCQPCKEAWTIRCRKYTKTAPTLPTAAEVIAEIEWMLSLNQGSGYILKAIGYTGREEQLRSRLQKWGRMDVYRRLCMMEQEAA